ncbi:MAG: TIGR02680 family protein [Selenomonadaceae bacterium]
MNNRWKMNRIGFVNFWLYDEEIFDFAEGKLLLRGANASGKSITTQSFIPFILDGDKSPERLDPFGSKDRRMEYYFLGDGEKDDVTGYLFLEFKKQGTEQYRTIGIGQRAQRGKSMAFWGFALIDGRRIGYDFKLYKEAGSKKLPLSRIELTNLIDDKKCVQTTQREYMEMVNHYIFGFQRLDQYDQFIRLMIKVRAPKLSRDFKPSQICGILNESLQILSDDDLRTMVEAMEKIEDIQTKLDGLKAAFKDAGRIKTEYDRYNQFILGRKAQAYLQAKKQLDELQADLDLAQQQCAEKQERLQNDEKVQELRKERRMTLQHEREVMDAADLDKAVQQLQISKENSEKLKTEVGEIERQIKIYEDAIRQYDRIECELNKDMENVVFQTGKIQDGLKDINAVLQLAQTESLVTEDLAAINEGIFRQIHSALQRCCKSIDEGIAAMQALKEIRQKWDQAEEAASKARGEKREKEEQQKKAWVMENQAREALLDAFYDMAKTNKEFRLSVEDVQAIAKRVEKYQGAVESDEIKRILERRYTECYTQYAEEKVQSESREQLVEQEYKDLLAELKTLQETKELPPQRSDKVDKARKMLLENHISFIPFYAAVEFAEGLSVKARDLLEEQLEDAGVLDALVVAPSDLNRARKLLCEASDRLLSSEGVSQMFAFDKLVASDVDPKLQTTVTEFFYHISEEENADISLVLRADGYFRNGVVKGHSMVTKSAAFIGVKTRAEQRQRKISEKEAECSQMQAKLEVCRQERTKAEKRLEVLMDEQKRIPAFSDLEQGLDLMKEAVFALDKATQILTEKEAELELMVVRKKRGEQEVIDKCRSLPFERKLESYKEAKIAANEYRDELYNLSSRLNEVGILKTRLGSIGEQRENKEETLDSESHRRRKAMLELGKCKAEIKQREEFLAKPEIQEMAKRLQTILQELQTVEMAISSTEKNDILLQSDIKYLGQDIARVMEQTQQQAKLAEQTFAYYREELDLELSFPVGDRSAESCVKEVAEKTRDADRERSVVELTSNLLKIYQQHSSNLSSYGISVESCFAEAPEQLRRRQCIVSTWQGKKLSFLEFYDVLKEAIDSTALLIQDKDRKLFEDILTDTLSRKLNNRIIESRNWIRDMSALMEKMDTSMGLTFSLEWKPQKSLLEDEIDTLELEKLLNRDRDLLTKEDIEKVSVHFRSKIAAARQAAEENNVMVNYSDLIRDALDYRKWFDLKLLFRRIGNPKKELTNNSFNTFSGGEKAMAMYVPLFAAVSSQYKKAEKEDCPRIIALDEAFAGVDEKNINSMFGLVDTLDFDYIMNSQALWGCYESVHAIKIAELLRSANGKTVTVIYYHWNGKERILDEA